VASLVICNVWPPVSPAPFSSDDVILFCPNTNVICSNAVGLRAINNETDIIDMVRIEDWFSISPLNTK
jgi:hypothetical protein